MLATFLGTGHWQKEKKKANIVITASIGLITPGVVEWEVENPAYHILTNLSLW